MNRFLSQVEEPTLSRGWRYFREDRVEPAESEEKSYQFLVFGSEPYSVSFYPVPGRGYIVPSCNCPAPKPCKHMVAAAFYSTHRMDEQIDSKVAGAPPEKPYFVLHLDTGTGRMELAVPEHGLHGLSESLQFKDVRKHLGKNFFEDHWQMLYEYRSSRKSAILEMIRKLPTDMISVFDEGGNSLQFESIRRPDLKVIVPRSAREYAQIQSRGKHKTPYPVRIQAFHVDAKSKKSKRYPEFQFVIEKINGSRRKKVSFLSIEDVDLHNFVSFSAFCEYDEFLKLLGQWRDYDLSFDEKFQFPVTFGPFLEVTIRLDPEFMEEPVLSVLAEVCYREAEQVTSKKTATNWKRDLSELPESYGMLRAFSSRQDESSQARFLFWKPTDTQLNAYRDIHLLDEEGCIAKRDFAEEMRLHQLWRQKEIPQNPERTIRSNRFRALFFEQIPAMLEVGAAVYIESEILDLAVSKARSIFFNITSGSGVDWFEGAVKIEGLSDREMVAAIEAFKAGKDFIKGETGEWINIKEIGIERIFEAVKDMGLTIRKDGTVSGISAGSLVALEKEIDLRTKDLKKRTRETLLQWSNTKAVPFKILPGFKARLRPYQKQGAAFMLERHRSGAGGILADDMGLGKTVQTLAVLHNLSEGASARKPRFLVVCPTAALGVWAQEAQRFAAGLSVTIWHGSSRKGEKLPTSGLVVTSFGVLVKDREMLEKVHFESIIVDEAQFAKNHLSVTARSLRTLKTKTIFCLTGTPMENHATELWALLDLILPGYAGTRKAFQARYKNPDGEALASLRKRLSPVLLRRRREEVLTELPEKTVQDIAVPMTEKQIVAYEALRREAKEVLENAGSDYLMLMLPYLMRLRRIACHPGLDKSAHKTSLDESGKFNFFLEQKEEIESSSGGILVFSQFTDVLDLFEDLLKKDESEYFRLDGSTPAKKRTEWVKRFQNGERKYFLISLKAGGSALTLHRANTVIHLDPWWNPAVEEQATARAHRMGQTRNVFVYRYISKGSVEEKVVFLQNKKRKLFHDLLDHPDSSKSRRISKEDIMDLLEM